MQGNFNKITSYEANMSPTHFRGPPPKGKYLKKDNIIHIHILKTWQVTFEGGK